MDGHPKQNKWEKEIRLTQFLLLLQLPTETELGKNTLMMSLQRATPASTLNLRQFSDIVVATSHEVQTDERTKGKHIHPG